jgi:hypothetical protein
MVIHESLMVIRVQHKKEETMTKKTYLQPTLEVVKIQTATMLATSVTMSGLDDVNYSDLGGDPGDAGARFFDEGNDFAIEGDDWDWSE